MVGLRFERELGPFLRARGIEQLYILKEGTAFVPDVRPLPRGVRALVHCVFHATYPHGDVYAKISPCVEGERAPRASSASRASAAGCPYKFTYTYETSLWLIRTFAGVQ